MNDNNYNLGDPEETADIDVIKDVNINNKLNLNIMTEIINSLPKLGIYNPIKLLDILVDKNSKELQNYMKNNSNILEFIYNQNDTSYNLKEKNIVTISLLKHLKKGSYHHIYKALDKETNNYLVIRKQIDNNTNDLYESCSDFFIHCILSLYQGKILINHQHFRGKSVIPKIIKIGVNEKKNKMLGIMNLFNGTLYQIIQNKSIKKSIKIKIILNSLYQIAYYLDNLQKIFQFNHNDLKVNNIFYQSEIDIKNITDSTIHKINFFLGDFGFSRIKIIHPTNKKKVKVYGGALLSYSKNKKLQSFIPGKDLYFLSHNIFVYSSNNIKAILISFFSLFNDFNVSLTEENNWFKIYDDYNNHLDFEPSNFIRIIKNSQFNQYINSLEDLINKDLLNDNIKLNELIKKE